MASTEQLTAALTNLLNEGVRAGVLSQTQADQRLRDAGVVVAAPAREVTITAQVTGDVNAANGYGRDTINRQVEQVLAGAARQVGLTVAAGSVRVNL
jgi:hypothetical protein